MELFPGYAIISGSGLGGIANYSPSLPELALGLGGVAVTLLAVGVGTKILRILPTSLSDANVGQDPL